MKTLFIAAMSALCVLVLCSCSKDRGQTTEPSEEGAAAAPAGGPASQPATRPAAAKDLMLDLGDGVTMKLALIPAGKFTMGSGQAERLKAAEEVKRLAESDEPAAEIAKFLADEGPQWEVTISRPFYMGVHEVTQAQWRAVMGTTVAEQRDKANRSWPLFEQGDNHPMYYVSWEEAVEFCKKLSGKTGKTVRLPTEAEWEYACRAGTKTPFSFGDDYVDVHEYANYCDKSNTLGLTWQDKAHSDGHDKTAPVGSFKPNPFGLHDMHGNVLEWCSDWYAHSYLPGDQAGANAKNVDPTGPPSGWARVLRGGSWSVTPTSCRSAHRGWDAPAYQIDYGFGYDRGSVGLRVVVAVGGVD